MTKAAMTSHRQQQKEKFFISGEALQLCTNKTKIWIYSWQSMSQSFCQTTPGGCERVN